MLKPLVTVRADVANTPPLSLVVAVTNLSTVPSIVVVAVDELVGVSPAMELKLEKTSDCALKFTVPVIAASMIPPSKWRGKNDL